jgi:hypothetical protein
MSEPQKTITVKVERNIPASITEVFDSWLNPKTPGTPWSIADKVVLNAQVDGLFFLEHERNGPLRAIYENRPPCAY